MKTPPELTPEYRATLTELRSQCEAFLKRRAALTKKLATESVIEAKVAMRLAILGTKLEENPGDPKSVEELHGRKLQKVLLGRTMDEGRQKLARTIENGDEVMQCARRAVKEQLQVRFGEKLPKEAELLEPAAGADLADAGRNMVDVLTFLLGDGEARAERARQYNEAVARFKEERRERARAMKPKIE